MKKLIKRIILVSIVALVAVGAVIGAVLGRAEKRVTRASGTVMQNADEDADVPQTVNILLMGLDSKAGLCDVIMLVGIDRARGRVTVAQIPRDTYAEYSDSSYKKLNGAYSSLGGAEQTAKFLADAFDITVHHYACISLDTFSSLVDAVGGVDVDVPCDMKYRDPEQGLYIDLKAGMAHLDGRAAQQFVRYRSGYADGDLGRIDAQKLFMAAALEKLACDVSVIDKVRLAMALDGVETDMSISDLLALSAYVIDVDTQSIALLTLPGKEATATQSGAGYYVISKDATAEIVEKYFAGKGDFDPNKTFLNDRYDHFGQIYGAYAEYSVISVDEIIRKGIDL